MSRFQGKRILITGATSGIGRAGALRIAAEGGQVVATGRNAERLKCLQQTLPESAIVLRSDVADIEDINSLAQQVRDIGGLDGLWLNAGFARVGPVEEVSAEAFDEIMGGNLKGPILQMAALSELLHDHASVVLTSSTAVYEGAPSVSLYAAAKGAITSLTRCWAASFGARNIRVNTLVPGPIETNFRDFMPAESRIAFEDHVASCLALPRFGTAEEAAAVGTFLLSDDAAFVTGAQYMVDGGLVMR